MECHRLMEWLNFIATELHKTLGAFFNPKITPEWKDNQIDPLRRRADWVAGEFAGRDYLTGVGFGVADAYLFTVLGWCKLFDIDLGPWPVLQDYMARIAGRPAVQAAMQAKGLIA